MNNERIFFPETLPPPRPGDEFSLDPEDFLTDSPKRRRAILRNRGKQHRCLSCNRTEAPFFRQNLQAHKQNLQAISLLLSGAQSIRALFLHRSAPVLMQPLQGPYGILRRKVRFMTRRVTRFSFCGHLQAVLETLVYETCIIFSH